jgi:glycosyltransferase involved in cell wall biosynthesis
MERPDAALPMLEGANKINPSNDLRNTIKEIKKKKVEFNRVVKIIKKIENIEDKKRLAKELDKIPDKLKSHPSICIIRNKAFVKETSSGKDLVFFCGFTARQWTPDTVKEGIGGSEEAIITLTKKLADRGWNVTVYNNCGYKEQRFGKVLYKPFWTFNYRDKQDIVIGWRIPALCDWGVNAKRIYIDLHDVIPSGEFNKTRLERIYKIFVKSKFQRNLYPDIPDEKFVIIPNGIDAELFSLDLPKNKNLMINTSSPDRSLNALCDLFKEVRKKVPAARCQWAYGWDVFDTAHSGSAIKMQWKADLIKKMAESGVEDLGRVSHEEVAKMYLTANIFAYPSEFAEIDCISLSKAMAAGAIPVTSDFSALGEKTGHGGVFIRSEKNNDTWAKPFQYDFGLEGEEKRKEWVEAVVKLLENPPGDEDRKEMRQWSRETFDWNKIADLWDKELKG